ncbi:MAG: UDP-3-O-(3-hydroxymyristoyl)glucosamine N-acyltransferase [Candidatus Methylacidiphilales bacterium]
MSLSGGHLTLAEIAHLIHGTLTGDPSTVITGVNDLGEAQPSEASFLGHPKYRQMAASTRAGVILVNGEEAGSFPCAVIRVENPSSAFGKLVNHFLLSQNTWEAGVDPMASIADDASVPSTCYIGPQAIIESGVTVGENSYIAAGVFIGRDSKLGSHCHLHPRVVIRERSLVGSHVIIQPGAVIGSDGFGYEFQQGRHVKVPQVGFVQIDDHVEIGANTTIDRGRFGRTWIKEGTKIDNLVMVAHNVSIGPHAIIVAQCGISGSSHLGAYVTMAGQSAVVGHVRIGDQVTLTAWTAVTKDIPEKGIYRGGPAKPMRESMKIEALTMRLPELYQRLRDLESKLGGITCG